jgi:hypothetical protein
MDPKRGFTRWGRALALTLTIAWPSTSGAASMGTGVASMPPGYFLDPIQANAARPADRVAGDGDFRLFIRRKYEDKLGEHLLDIAEATYPPREAIIDRAIERELVIGSDSARTSLWWEDGAGVSRIPYAVTAGAVAHYLALTDRFRDHNFRGAWDRNLFWTDFKYEASIERRGSYSLEDTTLADVYVAEMSLAWSFDDGTFVPVCLAHRIVVLTRDGKVLYVSGDGYTDEQVYMSSHRGIGRSEHLSR